jgi:hypothetical protein
MAGKQTDPFAESLDGSTTMGRAVVFFSIVVLSFLATILVIATAIPK